ncbi:MAG: hypothetical protein SGI86_03115 [Deltaproteobacteria bacterium]|nr:hypothetical protein [Deltaproteobacteria bacterium]
MRPAGATQKREEAYAPKAETPPLRRPSVQTRPLVQAAPLAPKKALPALSRIVYRSGELSYL